MSPQRSDAKKDQLELIDGAIMMGIQGWFLLQLCCASPASPFPPGAGSMRPNHDGRDLTVSEISTRKQRRGTVREEEAGESEGARRFKTWRLQSPA